MHRKWSKFTHPLIILRPFPGTTLKTYPLPPHFIPLSSQVSLQFYRYIIIFYYTNCKHTYSVSIPRRRPPMKSPRQIPTRERRRRRRLPPLRQSRRAAVDSRWWPPTGWGVAPHSTTTWTRARSSRTGSSATRPRAIPPTRAVDNSSGSSWPGRQSRTSARSEWSSSTDPNNMHCSAPTRTLEVPCQPKTHPPRRRIKRGRERTWKMRLR